MLQKKICMLGAFSVGKTSLVQQFVHGRFSDRYHTTVGVTIHKKVIAAPDREPLSLVLWDMVGKDDYTELASSQVRGAAAYLLVVDPTRPATLDVALWIHRQIKEAWGDLPFVVAMNKHDLSDRWALTDSQRQQCGDLLAAGWRFFETSAKTARGVPDLFDGLVSLMLPHGARPER